MKYATYVRVLYTDEMSPFFQELGEKFFGFAEHPGWVGDEQPQEYPATDKLPLHVGVDDGEVLGQTPPHLVIGLLSHVVTVSNKQCQINHVGLISIAGAST